MNLPDDPARAHRVLGYLAVFHSALLLGLLFVFVLFASENWLVLCLWWLWIGLATLWFFWPIVLLFHRGRSPRRIIVPIVLGYLFYVVWGRHYSQILNPDRFGLRFGVELTPHSIAMYAISYGLGWAEAKKDARNGRLVLEGYGFGFEAPRAPHFSKDVRKRLGIELLSVSGCVVNSRIVGHADGRNDATMAEIKRRFGESVVTAAYEADRKFQADFQTGKRLGRADAERDIRANHLAIEVFSPTDAAGPDYARILREQFNIELRQLCRAEGIRGDERLHGHARGYNEVSASEIERRFGAEAGKTVSDAQSKYSILGPPDE